jgi:flagellar biosynthesis anti-sigma factor FlgM
LSAVSFERSGTVAVMAAAGSVAANSVVANSGAAGSGAADSFEPSAVVAAVASAASSAAVVGDVRSEKVAQLRAAIASGSYKVSASKLAEAMLTARALW